MSPFAYETPPSETDLSLGYKRHKPCQHLSEKKGLASQNHIFFHASLFGENGCTY